MEDRIVEFLINLHGRYKHFSFRLFEMWIWWTLLGATLLINALFWPLLVLCVIMLIVSYRKKLQRQRENMEEGIDS